MSNRIKAAIAGMKNPETTVNICLRADLASQFEALDRQLQEEQQKPVDSLSGGGRRAELAEQIEQLRARMVEHTAVFRLRALDRRVFRRMVAEHPPRQDPETGEVHERDKYVGVNSETFYDALIRACAVDVRFPDEEAGTVLDDDDWRVLLGDNDVEKAKREKAGEPVEEGRLTDFQFSELAEAAWMLNRGEVSIPFSPAASQIRQSSGTA